MAQVSDPADPAVADYVGLTDAARRMRHEPEAGYFIAEGLHVVRRAAAAGYPCRSLLVAPSRADDLPPDLHGLAPVHVASYDVLEAVTGFHVHRGVLASFGRRPVPPAREVLAASRRVVVMEAVTNHTNLGAVFRSAAGLGMDAVLLSPQSCDPLYRRCVRVSMGQVFAVPYAYLDAWPQGVQEVREAGFRVLALTPDPGAARLEDVHLADDDRVALLLGTEGPGLTSAAMRASDLRVRIPMAAGVDSLNVAAAAAVACWVVGRRP
ncbi:MAG: RNA methyltransferase [Actinomycetota bacterium]|nr:RNA methyltransferase [Actinomycetota bacterium]